MLPTAAIGQIYSQLDAIDILNHALKKSADLNLFRKGQAEHRKWLMSGEEIAKVAANRISFAELVVRSGMETATARKAMMDRGAGKPDAFGWCRTLAFEVANDLLWSPVSNPSK